MMILRTSLMGLAAALSIGSVLAAQQIIDLPPGDSLSVHCSTSMTGMIATTQADLACAALPTATPPPTSTPIPLTVTPLPTYTPIPVTVTPQPPTATPAALAGQPCPTWLHNAITTTGPDGQTYPTWHSAVDPNSGCLFGHEHGADPSTSHANSTLPAFGYAAAVAGMAEPHTGFKVWLFNSGDTVESNVPSKIADEDVRFVFHMGTSGIGRYVQQFHSFQLDYIDRSGTGRYAHLTGLADTGTTAQNGTPCTGSVHKQFAAPGCADPYEAWSSTRFQLIHPADPYTAIDQTRFGMNPTFGVFDPITARDPANNMALIYSQDVIPNPAHIVAPALSPQAYYQGCKREFYGAPFFFRNVAAGATYYTDAMGMINPSGQDAQHPIQQLVGGPNGVKTTIYKLRTDFCGNGIKAPN